MQAINTFRQYWVSIFSGIPVAIWLLSGVNLINRSGAMVVCFLTLYLTQSLHFSLTDAGWVMSCYGVGSIIGAYSGGYMTDKIGYYRVQIGSLIMNGILLLSTLMVHSFWGMCAVILLTSSFSEAFRPANMIAITLHSDAATRTRSLSLLRVAVNLAVSVALIGGGLLVKLGWHWLFWVDGLSCFAAAIVIHFYLPRKPNADIAQANATAAAPSEQSAYRDVRFLTFVLLTFFGAMVFMQFIWTVPAFFKEIYHWNEQMIGLISGFNGIVVMFVEMPLVTGIDGKRSRLWFVRTGLILYAIAYLAFLLPTSMALTAALLYVVFISFGEILVMPFSTSWATTHASKSLSTGQYMGLYGLAYSLSNVLAPLVGTQMISRFGYDSLWVLMALMSCISIVGFWWMNGKETA